MKSDDTPPALVDDHETLRTLPVGFEDCTDPVDFFEKYWNNNLMEFILTQTNSYSDVNATLNELYSVFGVLLASGVVCQSRKRDYWSTNNLKKNVAISSSIGQRRYETIFSKLHFVPTDVLPQKMINFKRCIL